MTEAKPKHVEIITSVDAYGDWDKGKHVFHENCILNFGLEPNDQIVLGEIKAKLERLKKLEKQLSETPPVLNSPQEWPVELVAWIEKVRKIYWELGDVEDRMGDWDALLESFEQLDSILPAKGEKEE